MLRYKKLKGTSLVELLAAIGISVALIGISMPLLLKQSSLRQAIESAETIKSLLSRTRNLSYNPTNDQAVNYYVELINNKNNTIGAKIIGQSVSPSGIAKETIDQVTIAKSKITNLSDAVNVAFGANTGNPQIKSGTFLDDEATINITSGNKTVFLKISPTGAVDIEK